VLRRLSPSRGIPPALSDSSHRRRPAGRLSATRAQDVATRTYVRESMGAREKVDAEILRAAYRAR